MVASFVLHLILESKQSPLATSGMLLKWVVDSYGKLWSCRAGDGWRPHILHHRQTKVGRMPGTILHGPPFFQNVRLVRRAVVTRLECQRGMLDVGHAESNPDPALLGAANDERHRAAADRAALVIHDGNRGLRAFSDASQSHRTLIVKCLNSYGTPTNPPCLNGDTCLNQPTGA